MTVVGQWEHREKVYAKGAVHEGWTGGGGGG